MAEASLGSAVLHARLNAGNLNDGLRQIQRQSEQTFNAIGDRLIGLGKTWSLAVTTPLTALAGVGVRSAMQLETFAASLEVLVGDVERANRAFDELYEFSANTPFTWRSLTEGVRVLAAFGVEAEDLVPTLSRLGDIAAGVQTPIEDLAEVYGRVLITGRFSMEEVNRLAERGIPVYTELAKQLGVTEGEIRDLVSAGTVGFPEMERMVRDLTSEGGKFFGMMEAQSNTVAGRLNRLRDAFEQVTDIIGERLLPLVDRAIAVGQRLTDWFVALDPAVQTTVVSIGALAAAVGPVLVVTGTIISTLPKVVAGLQLLRAAMLPLLGPVGILAVVAGGLIALSTALSDPGGAGLEQALGDAERAVGSFQEALEAAEGDMSDTAVIDSLNDSFTNLGNNLTGPVKAAFESMRNELLLTVQGAEDANAALTRIIVGGNLAQDLQKGGMWNARLSAGFRQAGAVMFGEDRIVGADQEIMTALLKGDLEEALRIARAVEAVLARAPQSGVIEGISEFADHLESVVERLGAPTSTTVKVDVEDPDGELDNIPKDNEQRTVELTIATATTSGQLFDVIEREGTRINRAVQRMGGTADLVLAGMERRADIFAEAMERAWHIPDVTASQFEYLVRRSRELAENAEAFRHAMGQSFMGPPGGTVPESPIVIDLALPSQDKSPAQALVEFYSRLTDVADVQAELNGVTRQTRAVYEEARDIFRAILPSLDEQSDDWLLVARALATVERGLAAVNRELAGSHPVVRFLNTVRTAAEAASTAAQSLFRGLAESGPLRALQGVVETTRGLRTDELMAQFTGVEFDRTASEISRLQTEVARLVERYDQLSFVERVRLGLASTRLLQLREQAAAEKEAREETEKFQQALQSWNITVASLGASMDPVNALAAQLSRWFDEGKITAEEYAAMLADLADAQDRLASKMDPGAFERWSQSVGRIGVELDPVTFATEELGRMMDEGKITSAEYALGLELIADALDRIDASRVQAELDNFNASLERWRDSVNQLGVSADPLTSHAEQLVKWLDEGKISAAEYAEMLGLLADAQDRMAGSTLDQNAFDSFTQGISRVGVELDPLDSFAAQLSELLVEGKITADQFALGSEMIAQAADRLEEAEAAREAERLQQAADQFAETVFNAGLSFADAVIKAIEDGDIPGIIRAGLQGAGSIFGSMEGLGSIPFLGGTLGVGTLISAGLGILGTIIGAASSGSDRAQREREQRRSASLPAINLNFTVNQTNNYQGGPSQPENEQAFRRQANVLFEELYRRHLGPRFDRIEQRLGIAGAGA